MKKVLVTGAGGFVGKYLCKRMLKEGWHVRGAFRSDDSLKDIPKGVEATQVESIDAHTDWSVALSGMDAVVHLAARVHVMEDTSVDPLDEYRLVNVKGTDHLARMAAATGVRRFVFMSSVKVNGERTKGRNQGSNVGEQEGKLKKAFSEKDIPAPQDPYAVSKWEAEQLLHKIGKETGLEVVILRPPLVYGEGVKANFLRLLQVVDRGIPLPLKRVNNRRSLIYLGNLVDAVMVCIAHPKAPGQTYLVSDGDDVSTPDLIRLMALAMKKPARLFPLPPSLISFAARLICQSETVDRLLNTLTVESKKIHLELKWKAPYTMTCGLSKTAEWYLKEISNSGC